MRFLLDLYGKSGSYLGRQEVLVMLEIVPKWINPCVQFLINLKSNLIHRKKNQRSCLQTFKSHRVKYISIKSIAFQRSTFDKSIPIKQNTILNAKD